MLRLMAEAKKHQGGCHCGKVRFEVTLDLTEPAICCNCSMCGRSGTMLRFVPATSFELLSGADVLTDYRFSTKTINHQFCSVCGIKSFAGGKSKDGTETRAINVRCLDDVDIQSLPTHFVDGKSR
jgi:hypothetical protein